MLVERIEAEVIIIVDSHVELPGAAGRAQGQVVPLEAAQAASAVGVVVAVALAHVAPANFVALIRATRAPRVRQRPAGVRVRHKAAAERFVRARLGAAQRRRQLTARAVVSRRSAVGLGNGGAGAARGHDRGDAEAGDGSRVCQATAESAED